MTMKKILFYFYFCAMITSLMPASTLTNQAPNQELPLVISVCAYNCAAWVTKNLDSIFAQNYSNFRVIYIDDASDDATVDLVKQYIETHSLHDKITLITNPIRVRKLENIYKAFHSCKDEEIIIQVDADDWLPHNDVLQRINEEYSSGTVWLTYSDFYTYPEGTKEWCTPMPVPEHIIENRAYRNWEWVFTHMRTFNAWLFKEIKLQDLIAETSPGFEGKFFPICNDMASFFPMLEMCGTKFSFIPEKLYVYNRDNPNLGAKVEGHLYKPIGEDIRQRPKYSAKERPVLNKLDAFQNAHGDIIILSTGTAKALTQLLNSLSDYVTGVDAITVLYQGDKASIKNCAANFQEITFIPIANQSVNTVLQNCISRSNQKHILLATDTIYAQEKIDLNANIIELEKTGAYAFYFGYAAEKPPFNVESETELVPCQHVWHNTYAWRFNTGKYALFNNIDMTLFSKDMLIQQLQTMPDTHTIDAFLTIWHNTVNLDQQQVGLFYATKKISDNSTTIYAALDSQYPQKDIPQRKYNFLARRAKITELKNKPRC